MSIYGSVLESSLYNPYPWFQSTATVAPMALDGFAQAAGALGAGMGMGMMMMGDLGFQEGGKYKISILIEDRG